MEASTTTPEPKSFASKVSPVDYRNELKPVSAWKTGGAKLFSGILITGGALATTLGAIALVSGHGFGLNTMAKQGRNTERDIELAKKITRIVGGGLAVSAGIGTLLEKSFAYDPAAGAARARNFVELQEKLNAREASTGRA